MSNDVITYEDYTLDVYQRSVEFAGFVGKEDEEREYLCPSCKGKVPKVYYAESSFWIGLCLDCHSIYEALADEKRA